MNEKIVGAMFPEAVERVKQGKCASCGSVVDSFDFRDVLSVKEYKISGLCQKCQDRVFGK